MADVSSVLIEEISGLKRSIELRGPSLPQRGAAWGGKQKLSTTWYPGNGKEGTQQVFGTEEATSQWEGRFTRTLMGRTPCVFIDSGGSENQISSPAFMVEVFESIISSGSRLRVTWAVIPGSGVAGTQKVREGRASVWEFPHDTIHDIGWKVTFDWVSRGGSQQKVVATRDQDAGNATNAMFSAINDVVDLHTASPIVAKNRTIAKSASQFSLGQLESLANLPAATLKSFTRSLQQIASDVKKFGDIVKKFRSMPSELRNTVLAFVSNTISIANNFTDEMSRRPAEANSADQEYASVLRGMAYFGNAQIRAAAVAHEGANARAALLAQGGQFTTPSGARPLRAVVAANSNLVLAVVVPKTGDTLMSFSTKYYGDPDHAVDIAKANGLPWSTVTPKFGRPLVIPRLSGVAQVT